MHCIHLSLPHAISKTVCIFFEVPSSEASSQSVLPSSTQPKSIQPLIVLHEKAPSLQVKAAAKHADRPRFFLIWYTRWIISKMKKHTWAHCMVFNKDRAPWVVINNKNTCLQMCTAIHIWFIFYNIDVVVYTRLPNQQACANIHSCNYWHTY